MKRKLLFMSLIILMFFISNVTFAINPSEYEPTNPTGYSEFTDIGGNIISILKYIGIAVSAVVLAAIGIKYMAGSVEEKAEYKQTMMPYIVGCVFLMCTTGIVGFIDKSLKESNEFADIQQDIDQYEDNLIKLAEKMFDAKKEWLNKMKEGDYVGAYPFDVYAEETYEELNSSGFTKTEEYKKMEREWLELNFDRKAEYYLAYVEYHCRNTPGYKEKQIPKMVDETANEEYTIKFLDREYEMFYGIMYKTDYINVEMRKELEKRFSKEQEYCANEFKFQYYNIEKFSKILTILNDSEYDFYDAIEIIKNTEMDPVIDGMDRLNIDEMQNYLEKLKEKRDYFNSINFADGVEIFENLITQVEEEISISEDDIADNLDGVDEILADDKIFNYDNFTNINSIYNEYIRTGEYTEENMSKVKQALILNAMNYAGQCFANEKFDDITGYETTDSMQYYYEAANAFMDILKENTSGGDTAEERLRNLIEYGNCDIEYLWGTSDKEDVIEVCNKIMQQLEN